MSDAELPTGYYYIRNAETFAGRNRVEDRSLRPKRVNCPPDDPPEVVSTLVLNALTLF